MNKIVLTGCTPTPLASYLKALGVLRLLSAKYPKTRGFWRNEVFVLRTPLDRDAITQFFLEEYEPTPLVAPWGARSGFYKGSSEKTAREALSQIEASHDKRLSAFQAMIHSVRRLLAQYGFDEKASDDKKLNLMQICRCELPDELLDWLDTCYILTGGDRRFPPLLGTGGNEGSGSYVSGFAQQIVACIISKAHDDALSAALFDSNSPGVSIDQTPGHFAPGVSGGLNASVGFEDGKAKTNPWDYILALEGTIPFAGAVVRRSADDPSGDLSYPFTVHATFAGSGSLAEGDGNKPRGEMWLPVWNQPSLYLEIKSLMAEGRIAFGKKQARDGLDVVRGIQNLGGYRGVHTFHRYGLLKRNGKSYFAIPMSRIEVSDQPYARWLDDLDKHQWLDRFRRFARDDNTSRRFHTLRKRLEDMLFALSGQKPAKADAQALLTLLGEIQLALSIKARVSKKPNEELPPPIPRLSEQWVIAADDGSPAFRIAKALAGLRGVDDEALPLRSQLFPVERKFDRWMTPEAGEKVRIYTPAQENLSETLCALLQHRLWLAEKLDMRDKPLTSPAGITLGDMAAFLRDDRMDARIAALLPGLALCTIPKDTDKSAGDGALPAAFALLKMALTPDRILRSLKRRNNAQRLLPQFEHMPIPVGMVARLSSGNDQQARQAVQTAWRRLRASGLPPLFDAKNLPSLSGIHPQRAAAALLIPLRYDATGALARQILRTTEHEPVSTHNSQGELA